MDANQRDYFKMSNVSLNTLVSNGPITATFPPLCGTNITLVQTTLPLIQNMAVLQDFNKIGITISKKDLRKVLCSVAADSSRKMTTFAKYTSNIVLLNEIKITETELSKLADFNLKTKAQEIYDRIQTNLAALTAYGISAATQTAFLNAITGFNNAILKPQLNIEERKQNTTQLAVLFKTLKSAYNIIDASVELVRLSQPIFYANYKAARKIKKTGNSSFALRGQVLDSITGIPIKGVILSIMEVANADKSNLSTILLSKISAEKGGFNVLNLKPDIYTIKFSKPGYIDQIVNVAIASGDKASLKLKMVKLEMVN